MPVSKIFFMKDLYIFLKSAFTTPLFCFIIRLSLIECIYIEWHTVRERLELK